MFERLQQKWKVSGSKLALIVCTFAIGGSLTGYIARKIIAQLPIDNSALWVVIYILLITIIWPLAVIIISIPFGQFGFFRNYLRRIGRKMGIGKKELIVDSSQLTDQKLAVGGWQANTGSTADSNSKAAKPSHHTPHLTIRIAIFASGTGTNAQKIIDSFRKHPSINVSFIVSNKAGAGVLKIAEKENIPSLVIEKEKFFNGDAYVGELKQNQIDFIVLAGFLWKIPSALIKAFPNAIINIHPALLPAYGGKSMYGHKVHEAVIAAKEKESGITIHYVDEIYDHGKIIFQATCPVSINDTPLTLAQKIHQLEHEHFPKVIEELLVK